MASLFNGSGGGFGGSSLRNSILRNNFVGVDPGAGGSGIAGAIGSIVSGLPSIIQAFRAPAGFVAAGGIPGQEAIIREILKKIGFGTVGGVAGAAAASAIGSLFGDEKPKRRRRRGISATELRGFRKVNRLLCNVGMRPAAPRRVCK